MVKGIETGVEEAGPCRKTLNVHVPFGAMEPEYTQVVGAYAEAARIPGFRKGKAPAEIVERMYGARIADDVQERFLPRYCGEALEHAGISPVAIMDVSGVSFSRDDGLKFRFAVDVEPEFKLPKYRKFSLRGRSAAVSDSDVDATMERLRAESARFEDIQGRPARKGDMALVDYSGRVDGRPVSEIASDNPWIGENKDFWLLLDGRQVLPGVADGLIGAGIGEEREVSVVFPSDYGVPALAGLRASYKVRVKSLRERILPELDEGMLKAYGVDSVEGLRRKVSDEMVAAAEAGEKERLKNEIASELLKNADFPVPRSLVERETRAVAGDIVRRMSVEGATRDVIEARRQDILDEAERKSEDRVRLSYILDRIADAEKVEVDESEIERRIAAIAEGRRISAERLRSELEKHGGVVRMRSEMRADKTLDLLLSRAKIRK